ncbi:heavy metal translocating P-type ATPase [Nguyenibacter vanlangensis]|uniref:P-type Zn(2+) transporter n=1 Tax=Nguyenibacter vanlangensis TaxID=1216886 RepID=A0A7Y7M611_9PROT|nr:heavy metal translocating P-type ATPase [Nguyenibacter vanlangensis]NVN10028.1 heavy metal translocating P-type ATPase [Nguyenibacter vanlangensis]
MPQRAEDARHPITRHPITRHPITLGATLGAILDGAARHVLLPLVAGALCIGGVGRLLDRAWGDWFWMAGTAVVLCFLLLQIALTLRRGEFGLDLIAALAMGGALLLGQNLAGIIIALMFAGGEALEGFAQGRARREMTALLDRVPRSAARYDGEQLRDVPLAVLLAGDRILVRQGDVVPVDGLVTKGIAVLDESALTGEALPVSHRVGAAIVSGTTNAGDAFDMQATSTAADSTYAGIVRLVEAAGAARAPMVRLADRYALVFFALTLFVTGAAWIVSRDPVRALAVLVVATPCPLILAVPVAIMSGISRCARRGILVKGGGALEQLSRIRTVIFDKTGTLTDGRARILDMMCDTIDPRELLRIAASLDQVSHHVVARSLVLSAGERGIVLSLPEAAHEQSGAGVTGRLEGHLVVVGSWDYVRAATDDTPFAAEISEWMRRDGAVAVAVGIDRHVAGAFLLADQVRPEAGVVLRQLRDAGISRIVLATGDRADLAAGVGVFLEVDAVVADLKPQDKTAIVEAEKSAGPVLMAGDGVNDAPALAASDLGVAMGARGAAASSEAADIVILVDRLDRLVDALRIARRARRIALQSVYAGVGLSICAMLAAAAGYLIPVEGALLQEGIDAAVILNALRALHGGLWRRAGHAGLAPDELRALDAEHQALLDVVDRIRVTADRSHDVSGPDLDKDLEILDQMLRQRLLPHERQDDREIYARIRRQARMPDLLAGMSRTHMEIRRQIHNLAALRRAVSEHGANALQRRELQRLLYGLEAITRLHFAQEEEIYRLLERER